MMIFSQFEYFVISPKLSEEFIIVAKTAGTPNFELFQSVNP